jgi:uncharacterized protein YndB with AHSA1/START domain
MTDLPRIPGDEARASVLVAVPPPEAFRVFTEEIDRWWRQGLKYRMAGKRPSVLTLEPRTGGVLSESYETLSGPRVQVIGTVLAWDPPKHLLLEWRASNFGPEERTEVEITFEESPSGTLVTLIHRGWAQIRPDHPARHGQPSGPYLRSLGLWWGDLLTALRVHVLRPATC